MEDEESARKIHLIVEGPDNLTYYVIPCEDSKKAIEELTGEIWKRGWAMHGVVAEIGLDEWRELADGDLTPKLPPIPVRKDAQT